MSGRTSSSASPTTVSVGAAGRSSARAGERKANPIAIKTAAFLNDMEGPCDDDARRHHRRAGVEFNRGRATGPDNRDEASPRVPIAEFGEINQDLLK